MNEDSRKPESVKYLVGLLLAEKGIRRFDEAAARIGYSKSALSDTLSGVRRTAAIQRGIAELCGRSPSDLFGPLTHPDLRSVGTGDRGRIRAVLVETRVLPSVLAAITGISERLLLEYLSGNRRTPELQLRIFRAFRRLSGAELTMIQFWGGYLSKEIAA